MKDGTDLAMVTPVKPVTGVGDEAFIADNGRAIAFRKGNVAALLSATGLYKQTPMPSEKAIIEAAKRIAAKIE